MSQFLPRRQRTTKTSRLCRFRRAGDIRTFRPSNQSLWITTSVRTEQFCELQIRRVNNEVGTTSKPAGCAPLRVRQVLIVLDLSDFCNLLDDFTGRKVFYERELRIFVGRLCWHVARLPRRNERRAGCERRVAAPAIS